MLELERSRRLQEIQARLDHRARAEVQGGGVFRGGELQRRRLLHDGTLLWKVQGSRMKGRSPCDVTSWTVKVPPLTTDVCLQTSRSC